MSDEVIKELHRRGLFIYDVREIITDYFGEDNVDFITREADPQDIEDVPFVSSATCCIHFPRVRVANEHDRYTIIYDLFVRITVERTGTLIGGLKMIKSTYTPEQAVSQYSHSHLPRSIGSWENPCLGTGPLNHTINTLNSNFDADIWNLFCIELNSYVQVESLTGGPYIRLESIGAQEGYRVDYSDIKSYIFDSFYDDIQISSLVPGAYSNTERYNITSIREIVDTILKNRCIKFRFINNQWDIAHSCEEFSLIVSNTVLEIAKKKGIPSIAIERCSYMQKLIYSEGFFYNKNTASNHQLERFANHEVLFIFKNRPVVLTLRGEMVQRDVNEAYLLYQDRVKMVYNILIKLVNCVYGNKSKVKGKVKLI